MQTNLFGENEKAPIAKKPKIKKLNIELKLGRVCLKSKTSKTGFVCRGVPYSPNFLNRKHWAIRSRWKKAWDEEVWGRWQEEKRNWTQYEFPLKFRVRLDVYIFCITAQDEDNTYASLKGVIDGLVNCGIIKDDTIDDIRTKLHHVKAVNRKAEHIELIITKYD